MFIKNLKDYNLPDEKGFYGEFGGAFVREDFQPILDNLTKEFH